MVRPYIVDPTLIWGIVDPLPYIDPTLFSYITK